jgi:hypothetical protein
VLWNPGDDLSQLDPVVPADAAVLATDATHIVYASCRFFSQCLTPQPPLVIRNLSTNTEVTVPLQAGDSPRAGRFSPDGRRLAVTLQAANGRRVGIIDTEHGTVLSRPTALWLDQPPNGVLLQPVPFAWTEDGTTLLVVQGRPDDRDRRLSSFRAVDGEFYRSFSGVLDLQQVIVLDDQPNAS